MKNLLKKLFLVFTSSILLLGCNEDEFLTTPNPNAYDASLFYTKESDFVSALSTVYGALQYQSISGGSLPAEFTQSDLAWAFVWSPSRTFNDLTYNNSNNIIVNKWNELNVGINRANQVIVNLANADDALFVNVDKTSIEAQAKFLRAFFYFQMVHTYGQGVLRTDLVTSVDQAHQEMSTKDEITAAIIIPDLEFAKQNLPATWTGDAVGRVTKGAATSMLGKVYLYDQKWADAAAQFKEVIDSNLYALTPDYKDNFQHFREFNEESIFEVNYSFDLAEGASGSRVDDVPGGTPGAESTNLGRTLTKPGYGWAQSIVSYNLHELMVYDELADGSGAHSPRLNASIVPADFEEEYYTATAVQQVRGPKWNRNVTAYVRKYTNSYHMEIEPLLDRGGINFRHIRYADVLLMYAEALLEGGTNDGNAATAIQYIDMVRSRAKVVTLQKYLTDNGNTFPQLHVTQIATTTPRPMVPPTAANVLTHLQRVERPIELCFEGLRWKDLVRWGIAGEVLQDTYDHEQNLYNNFTAGMRRQKPFYIWGWINRRFDHFVNTIRFYNSSFDYWPLPNAEVQNNNAL